jgi:hypothetical protein
MSVINVAGTVDTPDLFSRVTTDGDTCKTALNLAPVTIESSAEIDFAGASDTPDGVSGVTADTDLLEFTCNVLPCWVFSTKSLTVTPIARSFTEEDIILAVDSPDGTIVGYRDVLELTFRFNSNQSAFRDSFNSSVFFFFSPPSS